MVRLIPFVALAVVGVLLAFTIGEPHSVFRRSILVSTVVVTAIGPGVHQAIKDRWNIVEPALWFGLFYSLHLGLRGLFLSYSDEGLTTPVVRLAAPQAAVNWALAAGVAAVLLFWVGYYCKVGLAVSNAVPKLPTKWSFARGWLLSVLLILIGWTARLYILSRVGLSVEQWLSADKTAILAQAGRGYLQLLQILSTAGVLSLLILVNRQVTFRYTVVAYMVIALELLWGLLVSSRGILLFTVLSLAVIGYLTSSRQRHIGKRYTFMFAVAGLGGLIVFPFLTALRAGITSFDRLIRLATTRLGDVTSVLQVVGSRFGGLDSFAAVLQLVPSVEGFYALQEIQYAATAWIPRALWPEKPVMPTIVFHDLFYPPGPYHGQTAAAISMPGELYWIGGLPALIVGMIGAGIIWRIGSEYFTRGILGESQILFYAFFFRWTFLSVEQSVVHFVTGRLYEFILLFGFVLAIKDYKTPEP